MPPTTNQTLSTDENSVALKPAATAPKHRHQVAFGSYRLKGEVLDIAMGQAVHAMTNAGIPQPLIDTALLYNNAGAVKALIGKYPNVRVGSKIHRFTCVADDVAAEIAHYGGALQRLLLHKHMSDIGCYLELVKAKAAGYVQEIGVCNYTGHQLEDLITQLTAMSEAGTLALPLPKAIPDVVQNEFHPFLQSSVPQVCAKHGILFEAHSVFAHLHEYPLDLLKDTGLAPAQLAMSFAVQRGGGAVVFNTTNYLHLRQNLDCVHLDEPTLARLDALSQIAGCHARYAGSDTPAISVGLPHHINPAQGWFEDCSPEWIKANIAPKIKADYATLLAGGVPTNVASAITKFKLKRPESLAAHGALATAFFEGEVGGPKANPDPKIELNSKIQRLDNVLTKIRRKLELHAQEAASRAMPKMCKLRAIEDPEALPVDIPDPAVLQPFIDLIAATTELPETAIRMERGTLFPDGRLDFCKQVSQPSFDKLCSAVLASGAIKHFLIGNNIALANDTDGKREAALASLVKNSRGIQTWYLAGNAISKHQVQSLCEALEGQEDAKYVWLKMNPIQTGSYYLGKLAAKNPRIELIDLFNTGQCDDGVAAFVRGFDEHHPAGAAVSSNLRHIYLDINAITNGGLVADLVARFPLLESLSVNVNQLGDDGMATLCDRMVAMDPKPPLTRFVAGSNGCTDATLPLLTRLVAAYPNLTILQLGSYKSTRFFQQQSNRFASGPLMLELAAALAVNVAKSANKALNYFGFQHAYTGDDATQLVLGMKEMHLHVNGVQWNGGMATDTSRQMNASTGNPHNIQPAPIEFIQSVYRNAM